MYLQFVVDDRDKKFQLILWRENDTDILQLSGNFRGISRFPTILVSYEAT